MVNTYNDYELVSMAHEGNEEAINILYNKYKPIIVRISNDSFLRFNHNGIEISDIMQEGYIGFDEAINNFDEKFNSTFYTFAILCVKRQISNYLKKNMREKDKILNEAVLIDDVIERNLRDEFDTEIDFITKETNESILKMIDKSFTEFEKDVFNYKLHGYSFEEIANILNKDIKSIYNTFHRLKSKYKKILNNIDI